MLTDEQRKWIELARAIGLVIHGKWFSDTTFLIQFISGDWIDLERAQQIHPFGELEEINNLRKAA